MRKLFLLISTAFLMQPSLSQSQGVSKNQNQFYEGDETSSGQISIKTTNLPTSVRESWRENYSAISGVQWYQTEEGYLACYEYKNFQSRILYDAEGNVRSHSREVDADNVPVLMLNFLKKKYPGMEFGKMFMTYPVAGENIYEVQVGDSWERFDANGNNIGYKTSANQAKK